MHFVSKIFALLISVCVINGAVSAKTETSTARDIGAFLETIYAENEPGAVIIVIEDGQPIFRRAYGMANLELGVRMEADMVFPITSLTKQFTAAAILLLEERGELSVDDEITRYFPGYPIQGSKITIGQLLAHTSGIFNFPEIPGYKEKISRQDLTTDELIDLFKSEPRYFAPGEGVHYSNSGYILATVIIEDVSGKPYADFIREEIFDPLGMTRSYYIGRQIIPGAVSGYQGTSGNYQVAEYINLRQARGAGGLLSTVDDLARWDESFYTSELLSKNSYTKMATPYVLRDGQLTESGYGVGIHEVNGFKVISHIGAMPGFVSFAARVPQEHLYVAVLSNNSSKRPRIHKIGNEIISLVVTSAP